MEKQIALQMIGEISNANGAPGFEDDVLTVLRKYGHDLGEMKEDSLRNLYCYRKENKGNRPIVQLDAHSDEVAFMVQAVKPNGTLRFLPLGGWVASNVAAQRVRVRNNQGIYIPGIIASKPPHFMSDAERNGAPKIEDMVIDIGASSYEEAVNDYHIRIGEPVVPDVSFEYVSEHDLMIGKGFDCRMGCASILATLAELADEELAVDVVGAFAAQEEVGVRGATITCQRVKPDIAIVFEGCPADDTFGESYASQTALKKGPMLRHIDGRMITNPRYQRYALDLAKTLNIPVQDAVRSGGATNGSAIHLSNGGVPVIVIGIPVRYAHTHYGISSYADFAHGVQLAKEILRRMSADLINSF